MNQVCLHYVFFFLFKRKRDDSLEADDAKLALTSGRFSLLQLLLLNSLPESHLKVELNLSLGTLYTICLCWAKGLFNTSI